MISWLINYLSTIKLTVNYTNSWLTEPESFHFSSLNGFSVSFSHLVTANQ